MFFKERLGTALLCRTKHAFNVCRRLTFIFFADSPYHDFSFRQMNARTVQFNAFFVFSHQLSDLTNEEPIQEAGIGRDWST